MNLCLEQGCRVGAYSDERAVTWDQFTHVSLEGAQR